MSFQCCWAQKTLGFVLDDGRKEVRIPFELYNNLVVVPVVLNGMLPLRFVVDTGVQTSILTQKSFSDILNLPYHRKYTISGPGNKRLVEAYVTTDVSLRLPGVHGDGHALLVLEEDYLELRNYLGTDVHGILGYELFSRFVVSINYAKKIMTITNPKLFKPKKKYARLPITVEDTKPYFTTSLTLKDGTQIDVKLLMDSGASHGLLLEPQSDSALVVPEPNIESYIGRGIGGEITGKIGRIGSLKLGDFVLKNPISSFPDPNSYMDSLKAGTAFRNGTIGGEILSRFTVIFNFPREEVYLKKNGSFKKKFYYNLSGLVIKAKGSDLKTFEIVEVRKQSIAEKSGIQEGDIVLSINGVSTRNLNLATLIGYFNSKPGKKIRVELNRDGQILQKRFVLESQI